MLTINSPAKTMADLLEELGGLSADRVRLDPAPGTATVEDVARIRDDERRLYELVNGVLVEKVTGCPESRIAAALILALGNYLKQHNLGVISGEGGMFRFPDNLVRIPDVAFTAWDRFADDGDFDESVPEIAPDLAVEVLSKGNTKKEMTRKLSEYFKAGVRLVWFIDAKRRSATVFTSPNRSKAIPETGILDGGQVLPGFRLPLATLFSQPQTGPKRRK